MGSKEIIKKMINCIRRESSYFPKFIDLFLSFSHEHKSGFVFFMMAHVSRSHWEESAKNGDFDNIVRGLLMEYSGRSELEEPTRLDFAKLIGKYVVSSDFKKAEDISQGEFKKVVEAM